MIAHSHITKIDTTSSREVPITKGYKAEPLQFMQQPRDLPILDWRVAQFMMADPTIILGLKTREAQVASAQFAYDEPDGESRKWVTGVKADDPAVADFVYDQMQRIWRNEIGKLTRSQEAGWAAGEVMYRITTGRGREMVEVDELLDRQPRHCYALTKNSRRYGVQIRNLKGGDSGYADIPFPKSYFVSYNARDGNNYGDSALRGALSPWADDFMSGGAKDVRRLFMTKDAYGSADLTYPDETYEIELSDGSTKTVHAREIADDIVARIQSGGTTSRPYSPDQSGKNQWELTRATIPSNPQHILQYPKDLDVEKLRGLHIPDEVIISLVGSGSWAGKQVPMETFLYCVDMWIVELIKQIEYQIIEPLVLLNWGRPVDFKVTHKPLVAEFKESGGGQETPAAGGSPPTVPPPIPFGGQQMSINPYGSIEQMVSDGLVRAVDVARAADAILN